MGKIFDPKRAGPEAVCKAGKKQDGKKQGLPELRRILSRELWGDGGGGFSEQPRGHLPRGRPSGGHVIGFVCQRAARLRRTQWASLAMAQHRMLTSRQANAGAGRRRDGLDLESSRC